MIAARSVAALFVLLACGCQPVDDANGGSPGRPAAAHDARGRAADGAWQRLEPGLELGAFTAPEKSPVGDSIVRVLRIDPGRFELRLLNASATSEGTTRTAKEWCRTSGAVAAINASMYQEDYRTSVSLMKSPSHVNNAFVSKDQTVLAFGRLDDAGPPLMLIDRECDDFDTLRGQYGTLVQSIRMVSCRGENVWERQARRWSTAAIGTDREGRVLFIHVRSPYVTHDLINILMELPIGLDRAMYVEGGPEAQLYVGNDAVEHEFVGSFETGFFPDDSNLQAWRVPNVIAVQRREGPAPADKNAASPG